MSVKKIKCVVCEEIFDSDEDLIVGDSLTCPGCYVDLKITKLNPIRVEEMDDSLGGETEEDSDNEEDDEF